MSPRKYTQKRRAAQQEETRNRIVNALMELHQELGAAYTTVSSVAERAGVQRLTVYRHFPDEASMLEACTSRWLELNPPPAPDAFEAIAAGNERLAAGVLALYRYYTRTQAMWTTAYRDLPVVEALAEPMSRVAQYLDDLSGHLTLGLSRHGKAREQLQATVRHALEFTTWRSLTQRGLSDEEAAQLVLTWAHVDPSVSDPPVSAAG